MTQKFYGLHRLKEAKPVPGSWNGAPYGPWSSASAGYAWMRRDHQWDKAAMARNGWCIAAMEPSGWRQREQWRELSGVYRAPPWTREPWWINSHAANEHYAHRAEKDPSMIAFTESPEKGAQDRQTIMKPGKYLRRFFPDLTAKQVAFMAEWWTNGNRPRDGFDKLKLKFAKTPADMVRVYEKGPESCMSGPRDVNGKGHPVQVYGAGDLAFAYLEDPKSGDITARALVWPAKKAVSRIYPTADNWENDGYDSQDQAEDMRNELFDRLKAEGYKSAYEEGWEIFDGARLLAIERDPGRYLMPYIDNLGVKKPTKEHRFWTLSAQRYDDSAGETSGYIYGPDFNSPQVVAGRVPWRDLGASAHPGYRDDNCNCLSCMEDRNPTDGFAPAPADDLEIAF